MVRSAKGILCFLNSTAIAGATYSWTGPNGFSSSLQNPIIPSATQAANGTYSLVVTVSGCSSSPLSTQVSVLTVPSAPVASSNGPLRSGDTLILSSSTVSNASYAWTGPNGFSSSLQNPVINGVATTDAGSYSVVATVNGCSSSPSVTSVSVPNTSYPCRGK